MNLSECLNSFIVHSHCCSQLSEFLSQCLQQNNSSKNLENITSSLGHTCVSHYNVAAIAFFEYILEFIFPSWHYNYQLLTCNYFIDSPRYQLLWTWYACGHLRISPGMIRDQIRDHCGQLQPRPLRHLKTHLPLDLKFRLRPEEDGPEAEQYMGGGTRQNSNVGGRLSASY